MKAVTAGALAALALLAGPASAQMSGKPIKIGVLSDMSSLYADIGGAGSVTAAQMAVKDFGGKVNGVDIQIVSADHLNKPDVGAAIARGWVDNDNVAAIVDLPNSGVALAVVNVLTEKNRVALASSTATSDLTGKACSPITVQWMMDTWAQGHSTAAALARRKRDRWFFLTVDYALGQALERDASEALRANGGTVLGAVRSPLGTTDFSSPLLQALASGANVIALANTGADAINAVKQAAEFGVGARGTRLAALFMQLSDVHALGLPAAQGLQVTTGFYWDLNDDTRAWSRRFADRMNGRMPTEGHAGVYAATLHYLRSVRDHRTMDGAAAVAAMKHTPVQDKLFGTTEIREDGRAIHPMYLFQVKTPSESRAAYDYYHLVQTIPANEAFRPLRDGGCKLVK